MLLYFILIFNTILTIRVIQLQIYVLVLDFIDHMFGIIIAIGFGVIDFCDLWVPLVNELIIDFFRSWTLVMWLISMYLAKIMPNVFLFVWLMLFIDVIYICFVITIFKDFLYDLQSIVRARNIVVKYDWFWKLIFIIMFCISSIIQGSKII